MDGTERSGGPEGTTHPDYRFLLANERTFLAWVRTALSLQVAGLGVLQFLTHGHSLVRYVLGIALVAAGSYLGAAGYLRYYQNDRAIRADEDLTRVRTSAFVALGVVALPLVGALVIVGYAAR